MIKIKQLGEKKLAGREHDALGFVDDLFAFCKDVGLVTADLPISDDEVVLTTGDGTSISIRIDIAAQGKFRFILARLCKLANDVDPAIANIFRAECDMPYGDGVIHVEARNALPRQYFVLKYTEGASKAPEAMR